MYSFHSRVRYSECDDAGRLSVMGMMNYLQDCSTFHSDTVGLGLETMRARNQGWILAAWYIEVDRLPAYGEGITVSTHCHEMGHLKALRNFSIADETGALVVRADSQWYLYDLAAARVMRIPEEQQRAYAHPEPRLAMGPMGRKIPVEGPATPATPVVATRQLLDTNHHVNNAQYVLIAQDALEELGCAAPLARLSVQYRSMALLGDTLVPEVHEAPGGHTVALTDGGATTYAVVRFQDRKE